MEEPSVRVELSGSQRSALDPDAAAVGSDRSLNRWAVVGGVLVIGIIGLVALRPDAPDESPNASAPESIGSTIPDDGSTPVVVSGPSFAGLGGPDPLSLVRVGDGWFVALGSNSPSTLWESTDGVAWSEVDIDPSILADGERQVAGLAEVDGGIAVVGLTNDGQVVQRFQTSGSQTWSEVDRYELPAGRARFLFDHGPSSIALLQGPTDSRFSTLLQTALADPASIDGVALCGLERAGPAMIGFYRCDDQVEPVIFSATELRPEFAMEDVSACAMSLARSELSVHSVLVVGDGGSTAIPLRGTQVVAASMLEKRDEFVFLADDQPGLRRRFGQFGDPASTCEGFGVVPEVSVAVGASLVVADALGYSRHISLPDDAEYNSSVAPNIGQQIVAAPDGGVLVLLGNDVWHVNLDTEVWTKRLRRSVTFASAGQTVLSSEGGVLVLVGSSMRVGSVETGEWVDVDVEFSNNPNVVYVDDEVAILYGANATFTRVPLPDFSVDR